MATELSDRLEFIKHHRFHSKFSDDGKQMYLLTL